MTNNNEELEYNDGLGDLLREKERHEFSWSKTTIVLLIVIFGIFVILTLVFNFSKNALKTPPPTAPLLNEPAGKGYQEKVAEIQKEKNNLELIEKLESSKIPQSKQTKESQHASKKATQPSTEKTKATPTYYRVYIGKFSSYDNAKDKLTELKNSNIDGYIKSFNSGANKHHRIQVAAFKNRSQAEIQSESIKKKGYTSYISTD